MVVDLLLNIDPKPLARAKPARMGKIITFYYPKKQKEEMEELKKAILGALTHEDRYYIESMLERERLGARLAVEVDLRYVIPMPKSYSKKKRAEYYGTPHTIKPDLDNLEKNILDRGNGILWNDDKCISIVSKSKVWGEYGCIQIIIKYNII